MFLLFTVGCAQTEPPPPPVVRPEPETEPEAPERERPEPPKVNKAPLVRGASITPRAPTVADEIRVDAEVTDPEGHWIDETYTWTADGEEIGGYHDDRLAAGVVKRGQVVAVRLVASDGENQTEANLGSVTVANASPVIQTSPSEVRSLNYLPLKARDPDGDPLTWKVEGAPEGLTVDAYGVVRYTPSLTAKAGKYTVKVIAEDGNGGWARLEFPVAISAGSDAPKTPVPPPDGAAAAPSTGKSGQ